jgi:hypothetical protein
MNSVSPHASWQSRPSNHTGTKPPFSLRTTLASDQLLEKRNSRFLFLVFASLAIVLSTSCKSFKEFVAAVQPPAPIYSGVIGSSSLVRSALLNPSSGFDKDSLVFSDDGKHYAYISGASGAQRIVLDGVPGQEFSRCSAPKFSPAGKLFFWAISGGKIVLSAAGQTFATPLSGEGFLEFSKDGAHWAAYGAEPESQNGSVITAGSIMVYEDGEEVGRYDDISFPEFSGDGKHLAFLFMQNGRMGLVVDGKLSATFDPPKVKSTTMFRAFANGPNMFMFTSVHYGGNTSLLALAQDANGWTIYKEGQPVASYLQNVWGGGEYRLIVSTGFEQAASLLAYSFTVAQDAPAAAWWERPSGKEASWRVALNGKPADTMSFPNFWPTSRPVLSHDGKHLAYAADSAPTESKKPTVFVVSDGTKFGPYGNVWGIQFTNDGKHLAYAASDGTGKTDWSYYLDGKPFGGKLDSVFPPAFSPNGRHVAWHAVRDKKHILAVDGQEVTTTDDVVWGPDVSDSGATGWAVRDESNIVRIATKIK